MFNCPLYLVYCFFLNIVNINVTYYISYVKGIIKCTVFENIILKCVFILLTITICSTKLYKL